MRKAIGVSALILALTCFAYAGEMPNGSPEPPPPAVQEQPEDGLTEKVLNLLESLLALF